MKTEYRFATKDIGHAMSRLIRATSENKVRWFVRACDSDCVVCYGSDDKTCLELFYDGSFRISKERACVFEGDGEHAGELLYDDVCRLLYAGEVEMLADFCDDVCGPCDEAC